VKTRPEKKIDCQFRGYSLKNNSSLESDIVNFGGSARIANSEYDFGWNIKSLPIQWSGPKGTIALVGSTSSPQKNWVRLRLQFKTVSSQKSLEPTTMVSFKLIPNSEFIISREITLPGKANKTRWLIDATCQLLN